MLRNEADRLRRVVVCTPRQAYFEATDFGKHNITELADHDLAIQQHANLKATLSEFGSEVIDIRELEGHPNSVFTRDTAVLTPNGYIKLKLGLPSRMDEGNWMSEFLQSIGEECAGEISNAGCVDGGDVVLAGRVAFVGRSTRTNSAGVGQISSLLDDMDYEVRVIDLPDSILHLDKVLMVVGKKRLLCCPELLENDATDGFETIAITYDDATSANIICLAENEVIVAQSNQKVVKRLLTEGVTTHVLNLSEFTKGNGGPNCLILPVDRWDFR